MKRFAISLLLLTACSGPRIIPDEKLSDIFHDVYLSNAYVGEQRVVMDSLSIYEPVFERYGYTAEDVRLTIGNFAKRKSSRLSDVVEAAIARLETESRFYRQRIFVRDTLTQIATETFSRVVLDEPSIRVRRIADTARMRRTIDSLRPGKYEISFRYVLDSADVNENINASFYLVDTLGRRGYASTRRFRQMYGDQQSRGDRVDVSLEASALHGKLVLDLNGYPRKDMKTPSLLIDSLTVKYYPPEEWARDSLSIRMLTLPSMDSLGIGYKPPTRKEEFEPSEDAPDPFAWPGRVGVSQSRGFFDAAISKPMVRPGER